MEHENAVLIVGGYGVVGEQVAHLLRARHPKLPILIGGRDLKKASALAQRIGESEGLAIDISVPDPLASLAVNPIAVLSSVFDFNDTLLPSAVKRGIPYVEIAGGTQGRELNLNTLREQRPSAAVMLASNWMAGVPAILSRAASDLLATTESVEVDSLYSVKDKAGPDTAMFVDHLTRSFQVFEDGEYVTHKPYSAGRTTEFSSGATSKVYTFDCQDHVTIPEATGARRVHVSLGIDNTPMAKGSAFLARTGLLNLFNLPFMKGIRRAFFFNPGEGASHEIVIRVTGTTTDGSKKAVRVEVSDPKGQSHLTACGATLAVESVLGLGASPKLSPGVYHPDTSPDIENTLAILHENGVVVQSPETLGVGVFTE